MDNYEFCVDWVLRNRSNGDVKVLDYGCGAGTIVEMLRAKGVNAFGCDVFYEGGNYSGSVATGLLDTGVIKRMTEFQIPFPAESFDLVVNNQVMEHVGDLDLVLREINRVLKPGGRVLSLFPDKGVWREGHCGIPLLHWFPKHSKQRVYYAAMLRSLGLGYHKRDKSVMIWSRDFCAWLDSWTYYRSRAEIDTTFTRYFPTLERLEDSWMVSRFGARFPFVRLFPGNLRGFLSRKLAGLAFAAQKSSVSPDSAIPKCELNSQR